MTNHWFGVPPFMETLISIMENMPMDMENTRNMNMDIYQPDMEITIMHRWRLSEPSTGIEWMIWRYRYGKTTPFIRFDDHFQRNTYFFVSMLISWRSNMDLTKYIGNRLSFRACWWSHNNRHSGGWGQRSQIAKVGRCSKRPRIVLQLGQWKKRFAWFGVNHCSFRKGVRLFVPLGFCCLAHQNLSVSHQLGSWLGQGSYQG